MPIPKPKANESENDFISRCMGDSVMNEEYPDNDQRAAVCHQAWREKGKSQKNTMEKKSIQIQLKEEKPGSFIARIAKLNVVDHDKDVTKTGAFPNGKSVLVSAYMHGSWMGELPVGKAVIKEDGDEVIAEGEFNLSTASGKETYETVKFSGALQEWSYGFKATEFEFGEQDGQEVRFLKKVEPYEISPVLTGAGLDTATLAIKSDKNGETLTSQAEHVLADVQALTARLKALAALRREEGRTIATASREHLEKLDIEIASISQEIKSLLAEAEPKDEEAAQRLYAEFLNIENRIMEAV